MNKNKQNELRIKFELELLDLVEKYFNQKLGIYLIYAALAQAISSFLSFTQERVDKLDRKE